MKNFHWGHGIFVFFVFFIGFLITVLVKSRGVDHSLVADDYYVKDIAYQDHYEKAANVAKYGKVVKVDWEDTSRIIKISIDGKAVKKGKVTFYRPSNQSSDFTREFFIPESSDKIEMKDLGLAIGRWKIQVEWTEDDLPFFVEKDIYVSTP